MAGALIFVIGLFIVLTVWKSYRKAEKWSWYTLLAAGIIGWGSILAYYLTAIGCLIYLTLGIVGTILLIVGIVLPAKAILVKKASGE